METDIPYVAHEIEEPEILPVLPALIICFAVVAFIILAL